MIREDEGWMKNYKRYISIEKSIEIYHRILEIFISLITNIL